MRVWLGALVSRNLIAAKRYTSHDTFNRFFQMLDPASVEECFRQWAVQLRLKEDDGNLKPDILAIDGKTHRIERKADYVLAIEGNHKTAYEEIKLFMDSVALECPAHIEHLEKDHGRIEYRRYWQSDDIDWFADKEQWTGLKSFAMVERVSETADGKVQTERRYYISSLKRHPELIAEAIRSHWGVENNVHWCLDVVFGEDQSRDRTLNAAKKLRTSA